MVREIQAKTLLSHRKEADAWFGLKYNMNLYRGCAHGCIYCDSRSDCYQLGDLADIRVKANALDLLRVELASKRRKGYIGTGSMNDPYQPAEAHYDLTGQALRIIAEFGFPVHIITKSDLVLKDLATLQQISRYAAAVSFTLTTVDDDLAAKVEPGAPRPSARLRAMAALAKAGVPTGVTMMPILPFIEDSEANVRAIIEAAAACGASYVMPALGVTLRDSQRHYFYAQLDRLFPGVRAQYEAYCGDCYHCQAREAPRLYAVANELCAKYGLAQRIKPYQDLPIANQPSLF